MQYIEVINLEKYQHYSDRPTIWIKWYFKALSDYKFNQLTDSERWLFVGIIMLGVQGGNNVPFDPLWVRNKVCHVGGKGVGKVRAGLLKMVDLGLIRINNAIIDKNREDKIREEKISSKKKPYYKGLEMRKQGNKWFCLPKDGGTWLEFNDKESTIEWK